MNDRKRSNCNSHLAFRNLCGKEASRIPTFSLSARDALYDRCFDKMSCADACFLI